MNTFSVTIEKTWHKDKDKNNLDNTIREVEKIGSCILYEKRYIFCSFLFLSKLSYMDLLDKITSIEGVISFCQVEAHSSNVKPDK